MKFTLTQDKENWHKIEIKDSDGNWARIGDLLRSEITLLEQLVYYANFGADIEAEGIGEYYYPEVREMMRK